MKNIILRIKCLLGFHDFDERLEGLKCNRYFCKYHYNAISWSDVKERGIKNYHKNSNRFI